MGFFSKTLDKLKAGLTRTREVLVEGVGGIKSMLLGRKLDEQLIEELEKALLTADVGVAATRRLIDGITVDYKSGKMTRGEDVLDYMKRELKAMWPEQDRKLKLASSGPTVILVTGINGAGKTTSIAKMCAMLRKQDKKVLLAACDTFRAGAVRQLEIWGERLGVEVVKGQQGGDPAAVAFDACKAATARGVDVLIVDTAGRLHTQDPLMRQLTKIRSVIARQIPGAPHETMLVLDATSGQNALRQAEEFSKSMSDGGARMADGGGGGRAGEPVAAGAGESGGITGIFLAKLDGTAKGGIVVAIRSATNIPVKFVGVGETPDDVEPFEPESFVEALFAA